MSRIGGTLLLAVLASIAMPAFAASPLDGFNVLVFVVDEQGNFLPGATVTLRPAPEQSCVCSPGTVTQTTTTVGPGLARFSLDPLTDTGCYAIEVASGGLTGSMCGSLIEFGNPLIPANAWYQVTAFRDEPPCFACGD